VGGYGDGHNQRESECKESGIGKEEIPKSRASAASVVPEQVSSTLEQIVNQLSIVTQTLAVFEERLNLHEHRMKDVEETIKTLAVNQQRESKAQHGRNSNDDQKWNVMGENVQQRMTVNHSVPSTEANHAINE